MPKKENPQAIGDYVIVHADEKKKQSEGGIILPDSAKEETLRGTVLSIEWPHDAPCGTDGKPRIQSGTRIMFRPMRGMTMKFNGKLLLVIEKKDIIATL